VRFARVVAANAPLHGRASVQGAARVVRVRALLRRKLCGRVRAGVVTASRVCVGASF
jgi:hypothetical protein